MANQRNRNNDKNRAPSADPKDVRDLLRHEIGVGDFAPQMAGVKTQVGLAAGVPGNVLLNPGFEDDLASPPGSWTADNSATFTATAGAATTDLTEGQNYGKWTLPDSSVTGPWTLTAAVAQLNGSDTPYVEAKFQYRQQALATGVTGLRVSLSVAFYDSASALINTASIPAVDRAGASTTWYDMGFFISVPSGTESAVFVIHAEDNYGAFVTSGSSVLYIDNCQLIPANFYRGYFEGAALTQTPHYNPSNTLATVGYVDQQIPTGAVVPWAGGNTGLGGTAAPPTGWLKCDGSAVSRETYSVLYDIIGVAFGAGDGLTTFNLPNMNGTPSFPRGNTGANVGNVGTGDTHDHNLSGTGWAKISMASGVGIVMNRQTVTAYTDTNIHTATGQSITGESVSRTSGADLGGKTDVQGILNPKFVTFLFIIKY